MVALLAVGAVAAALGVASAEGPAGSASPRQISVEGTATVPIGVHDSAAAATTAYREAQAKALSDGAAKAAFLAEKLGVALGVATTTVEQGGYIECSGTVNEYAEYEGEQPDFGSSTITRGVGTAAPAGAPQLRKAKAHHVHRVKASRPHATGKAAAATSCVLDSQVSVAYAIG